MAAPRPVNRRHRHSVACSTARGFCRKPRDFTLRRRYNKPRLEIAMSLVMPEPDRDVLARRASIVAALSAIVPGEGVIAAERAMRPYESDGLTAYRQLPMVVVLPESTEQVSRVLRYCHEHGVKVVPRGAGTSLSGGALPLADGVLLGMAKFSRIRAVDFDNRVVVAEPGVTNLAVSNAVADAGFYYAPDPSSQIACTIGGNVAENSGGVHCLKYGMTANNVLGCELVLMTGEVIRLGGKHLDSGGYDLLGIINGSEGLLGVVTEITVRILKKPECARALLVGFSSSEEAGACVSRIIGAGIIPGGMEMMDRPAIHAVEEFVHAGYPLDVEALLIVELDGPRAEVDHLIACVDAIARDCGAVTCRASNSEEERLLFWAGRKAAFPAVGRISPDYYCMDGTIPRARLPQVLARMRELSEKYQLRVANVFHAGDGNLHPLILYDANKPGELERTEAFGAEILKLCVEVGGVLTGEHGVGVEKRDLMPTMFSEIDLNQQQRLKCAFDDKGLLNPGKVFPKLHRCAELGRMHVHAGRVAFPDIPRF
jgi:glycolate oxidase